MPARRSRLPIITSSSSIVYQSTHYFYYCLLIVSLSSGIGSSLCFTNLLPNLSATFRKPKSVTIIREDENGMKNWMIYRTENKVVLGSIHSINQYGAALEELKQWALTKGYYLSPKSTRQTGMGKFWSVFQYFHKVSGHGTPPESLFEPTVCPACRRSVSSSQAYCTECYFPTVCSVCYSNGVTTVDNKGYRVCIGCAVTCKTCNKVYYPIPGEPGCQVCDPTVICSVCSSKVAKTKSVTGAHKTQKISVFCIRCFELRSCSDCKLITTEINLTKKGPKLCDQCKIKRLEKAEKWDSKDLPSSKSLIIKALAKRPVRTISIETEFDGDSRTCRRVLFEKGIVPHLELDRYSSRGERSSRTPAMIKSDGSVSGGELVTFLLDLSSENHSNALLRVTEVMKSLVDSGYAELSSRAGGHIHLDIHGFSNEDTANLAILFDFLEMPIYYMAGAGHEYGHRSLAGNSYGNPPSELTIHDKHAIYDMFRHSYGRAGIYFGNYVQGRNAQCRCVDKCACTLERGTVEWRVWNTQIVPIILHGWISFMQSLAAFAEDNPAISKDNYPSLKWRQRPLLKCSLSEIKEVRSRLFWIFENLVFTADERNSLIEVIKRSEMRDLLKRTSLPKYGGNSAFGSKTKARNPYSRKANLTWSEPKAKAVESFVESLNDMYEDDYDYGDY